MRISDWSSDVCSSDLRESSRRRAAETTGMKIGILGAGQLGRMLALAGYPLALDLVLLDPATEACAETLGEHIHPAYVDEHEIAERTDERRGGQLCGGQSRFSWWPVRYRK